MPGYRPLSSAVEGVAAEQVRQAESGEAGEPLATLESALHEFQRDGLPIPHWLCGRLAACYRVAQRYDDEVRLLERYRESQVTEQNRVRFDARLSKARILAERNRVHDNGALASIRGIRKPRSRPANGRHSPETEHPQSE